jgi:cobalt-zinc-cadmium resistance protein CzcA
VQTILPSEASLDEVDRLNHRVEDLFRGIPEVEDVVRRTGRAERTEDPMPHTISDVLIVLKKERSRSLDAIEDDMRERTANVPGVSILFTTPLGMRIDEGLGGTPADLSVRAGTLRHSWSDRPVRHCRAERARADLAGEGAADGGPPL